MRITPHERQAWVDQERASPIGESAELRGQIIVNGSLAEGRSTVALLLSWRREIPIETACALLALAPLGLDATAAKAWVGAIVLPEAPEVRQ